MKYDLIAIEGEYYSGAVEIGNHIAKNLGLACYASDVIQAAAARGHTSTEDIERIKQTTDSKLLRDVYTIPFFGRVPFYERYILDAEIEILRHLAKSGPYIIVESGLAKNALPELRVFSVFIYTSLNARIQYAVQQQVEASLRYATKVAKKYDRSMSKRYEAYSDYKRADHRGYDMVLDSEKLGFEGCVDAIVSIVKEKSAS